MKRFIALGLLAAMLTGCGEKETKQPDGSPLPSPNDKFDKSKDAKGRSGVKPG